MDSTESLEALAGQIEHRRHEGVFLIQLVDDYRTHLEIVTTIEIGGVELKYCSECVRPHYFLGCDGMPFTSIDTCTFHKKVATLYADLTPSESKHYLASPLADKLDTDKYDLIREHLDDELMAIQYAGGSHMLKAVRLMLRALAPEPDFGTKQAMEDMKKPQKVHVGGCLHSESPEVIINGTSQRVGVGEGESSSADELRSEGGLASHLYFKRCDGTFKNVLGEVLSLSAS